MSPRELVSCDTFVVLPDATKGGAVVFGKNSDRPAGEVQEVVYVPAADHAEDSTVQCTYIAVPQALHTHAVVLSKPAWMWGAEMGSNERGLCVGNEAVWTREMGPQDHVNKLLGMDLLRLALERAATAAEGVDVITALLAEHGQGGPCSDTDPGFVYHNSFLLADPEEAWVLETAGQHWAAKRLTGGFYHLSNALSLASYDKSSEGLAERAKSQGWWSGEGEMSFREAFSQAQDTLSPSGREEGGKRLLEKLTKEGQFGLRDMLTVLRDTESGICRDDSASCPTAASMVSVLPPSSPPHHWLTATPSPHHSVFKPFVFCGPLSRGSPWTISPDSAADRSHTLYRLHKKALSSPSPPLPLLRSLEQQCITETEAALQSSPLAELAGLYADCVESELKFYK